ncbi:MAG: prolyl oligopeptidase family serine peptidase [Acidobacteriaceae bacterium]
MPKLTEAPPVSGIETVTEILHGVAVKDPYRWLEEQESPRTREWLASQALYASSYLDAIPGRGRIQRRIRELIDIETHDSIQKAGNKYFFRKRMPGQEQPCIFFREGPEGPDQLLIDPAERGTGKYTAVKPLRISPDGRLLLYEIKEGGERTGTFELLDIQRGKVLPDVLPRGYLRGLAFAPDSRSFYYVHEATAAIRPHYRAAYHHVLGTRFADDQQIFFAGESDKLRLQIVAAEEKLGFLVYRFLDKIQTDFCLWPFGGEHGPEPLIRSAEYQFGPILLKNDRILALTNCRAPNFRIVEIYLRREQEPNLVDVIPERDALIQDWAVAGNRIFVLYIRAIKAQVEIFDLSGKHLGQLPVEASDTVRLLGGSGEADELFFEQESFTKPLQICRYSSSAEKPALWARREVPFDSQNYNQIQVWFNGKDGTPIPMFLVGRREILEGSRHPTIMTSYGGYGISMTPQFSVFVAFLLEHGCLFALPNIRGGSEFGAEWHSAAKRQKRQVAFDDFLSAAEWLIETGRTEPRKLAIFGGSNSGLLVAAAMTQRPELFRAVVCMVPMLDMLRYHLFDNAHVWKDEFGTADDPDDFAALHDFSPYHRVRDGTHYPATMIISGDSDQNCNPLHARKMTARLQAANASGNPILLDYSRFRGHSPVLPLSERIQALTDRMAFLCDHLELPV